MGLNPPQYNTGYLQYVCNGGQLDDKSNHIESLACIYHSTRPQPAGIVYLNILQELYSFNKCGSLGLKIRYEKTISELCLLHSNLHCTGWANL